MFELLATWLLSQAAGHYGGKVFDLVDDQLAKLLTKGLRDPKAAHEADALVAARLRKRGQGELSQPVHGLVQQLLVLPSRTSESAPNLPLKSYGRLINGTFKTVGALRPSVVALPSWFHTRECVVVIDCRDVSDNEDRQAPLASWQETGGSWAWTKPEPYYEFGVRRPHVWIIDCREQRDRDAMLTQVRTLLEPPDTPEPRQPLERALADLSLDDPARVRLLEAVYELKVELGRMPLQRTVRRSQHIEFAIQGANEFKEMQDALADVVERQAEREVEWFLLANPPQ
jgi:hypothetical protein